MMSYINETDFVIENKELVYPEIVTDGLQLYYDAKGKRDTDYHRDTMLDMSGNKNHGKLHNFAYEKHSGYKDGLVFDYIDDKLVRPKLNLKPDDFTFMLNGNIISFSPDGTVKRVQDGEVIESKGFNLVRNGDFSDGLVGWGIVAGTLGLTDKEYHSPSNSFYKPTAATALYKDIEIPNNHVTYLSAFVKGTNKMELRMNEYNTWARIKMTSIDKSDEWTLLSLTGRSVNGGIRIDTSVADGENYYDDFIVIDLTETFGEGNEPTKEQMDKIINRFGFIPNAQNLIDRIEYKGNNLGDMENIIDGLYKTEVLSGEEIYTNKADDAVVHVEVDGKSYQNRRPGVHKTFDFDGTFDMGLPIDYGILTEFTIVTRLYVGSEPKQMGFLQPRPQTSHIELNALGQLRTRLQSTDLYSRTNVFEKGKWYDIAITGSQRSGILRQIVNGEVVGETSDFTDFLPLGASTRLGGSFSGGRYWEGLIDFIGIYPSPLTRQGIEDVFSSDGLVEDFRPLLLYELKGETLSDRMTDTVSGSVAILSGTHKTVTHVMPNPKYPINIHTLDNFNVISSHGRRNMVLNTDGETEFDFNGFNEINPHLVSYSDVKSVMNGGQYTASVYIEELLETGPNGISIMVSFRNEDSGLITQPRSPQRMFSGDSGLLSFTFNYNGRPFINGDYIEVHIRGVSSLGTSRGKYTRLKLEEGENVTPWVPSDFDDVLENEYENIDKINLMLEEPLRGLEGNNDRLFRDTDGLWKINRNIGEVVIDGNSSLSNPANIYQTPNTTIFGIPVDGKLYGRTLSNLLPHVDDTQIYNGPNDGIGISLDGYTKGAGRIRFRIPNEWIGIVPDDSFSDRARKLLSRLSKNPLSVIYELEFPFTEILDQELQENLNNLRSFQDSNYVYTVLPDRNHYLSENLKPTLHAKFLYSNWYKEDRVINNLMIYNRALTNEEMLQNYKTIKRRWGM